MVLTRSRSGMIEDLYSQRAVHTLNVYISRLLVPLLLICGSVPQRYGNVQGFKKVFGGIFIASIYSPFRAEIKSSNECIISGKTVTSCPSLLPDGERNFLRVLEKQSYYFWCLLHQRTIKWINLHSEEVSAHFPTSPLSHPSGPS